MATAALPKGMSAISALAVASTRTEGLRAVARGTLGLGITEVRMTGIEEQLGQEHELCLEEEGVIVSILAGHKDAVGVLVEDLVILKTSSSGTDTPI